MKDIKLLHYQKDIFNKALDIIHRNKKVGLDIFTKGGKSFIAYALMESLVNDGLVNHALIVAPKAIIENLRDNIFNNTELFNRMIFINIEKMSRGLTMTEYIESLGYEVEDVNMIIFDECHHLFGRNIYSSRVADSSFVDSCYVVAMTASSDDTIRGFNKIHALVGIENTIKYSIGDAIKNNILRKIEYNACVLSYDKQMLDCIDALNNDNLHSEYVNQLINDLEKQVNKLSNSLEDRIYNYMVKNVKSLDCSKGATGFVFFNTINELRYSKDSVVNAVERLYNHFNKHDVTVNYIEYTSLGSDADTEQAKRIINNGTEPYVVNLIATVNKGSEGIHPENTQLELIMCETQSLARFIQMEGRVNNHYNEGYNPIIFDFKSNVVAIGAFTPGTIYCGRQKLYNRRNRSRVKQYSLMGMNLDEFEKETDNIEFKDNKEVADIYRLFNRISGMITLLDSDNKELTNVIDGNISKIDSEYFGNIHRFLKEYDKEHKTKLSDKYSLIQRYTVFNDYTNEESKMIQDWKNRLGYRAYIGHKSDKDECKYTMELFKDVIKQSKRIAKGKGVSSQFRNKYALDYLCENMNSLQCTLIQSEDAIIESITSYIPNIKASEYNLDLTNKYESFLYKIARANINLLNNIANDRVSEDKLESAILLANARFHILDNVPVEGKLKKYCDTITKFMIGRYSDIISRTFFDVLGRRGADKMTFIIHNYMNDKLMSEGVSLDTTLGYLSNNFKNISDIYKVFLDILGIKSVNKLYSVLIDNSKFKDMRDSILKEYSKEKYLVFKGYSLHTPSRYCDDIDKYIKMIGNIA